jgi:hypothetical protein
VQVLRAPALCGSPAIASYDAYDEITNDPESGASHDLAGQPSCDDTYYQYDNLLPLSAGLHYVTRDDVCGCGVKNNTEPQSTHPSTNRREGHSAASLVWEGIDHEHS